MTLSMARTVQEQSLLALVHPIAEAIGLRIVRLRMHGSQRPTLQIMAERDDGTMIVKDCARLSRAISAAFEVNDPISGEYVLEVSSPGLDRPLTRLQDFSTYAGNAAKVELDRMVEGRKRFRGTISGVEDQSILFDIEGEDATAVIPFDWIFEAKLMISDAMLKVKPKSATESELETELKEGDPS